MFSKPGFLNGYASCILIMLNMWTSDRIGMNTEEMAMI